MPRITLRSPIAAIALLALAACSPPVPDSGMGGGYDSYRMQRESALTSGAPVLAPGAQITGGAVTGGPVVAAPVTGFSTDRIGAAISNASNQPAGVTVGVPQPAITQFGEATANTGPVQMLPAATGAPSVPVRQAPVAVQNLPTRAGDVPNLVQYALITTNPLGTQTYERSSLRLRDPVRVCQGYSSADQAQMAFLDAGGPEKDRKGLDPDGDGYACGWDPTPFRKALN